MTMPRHSRRFHYLLISVCVLLLILVGKLLIVELLQTNEHSYYLNEGTQFMNAYQVENGARLAIDRKPRDKKTDNELDGYDIEEDNKNIGNENIENVVKVTNAIKIIGNGSKSSNKFFGENTKFYPKTKTHLIVPRRLVHLDLKGAPFRPGYFIRLFPLLAALNATGVVIEWEDMFPYSGRLAEAINGNAYTINEVKLILSAANQSGLAVVPLVQTLGHLEWLLKLKQFAYLRDSKLSPHVICFANNDAWTLIKIMLDQVASVHRQFGMPFFHMGADEAFHVGEWQQAAILWHISRTARHIGARNKGVRVLVWHDMLTNSRSEHLVQFQLPQLVEPVVWAYAEDLNDYLRPSLWTTFEAFPFVWGASAYKGADGPNRYHSNALHYLRNHWSWLEQIDQYHDDSGHLRGLILTGWSRYDHMAVLCELFPIAIPTLAMSLATISQGRPMDKFNNVLSCQLATSGQHVGNCHFPGVEIYQLINEYRRLSGRIRRWAETNLNWNGWLSRTAQKYVYSSSMYLNKINDKVWSFRRQLERIESELRYHMNAVFYEDAMEEFIYEYIGGDLELFTSRHSISEVIMQKEHFQKRPFIKHQERNQSNK